MESSLFYFLVGLTIFFSKIVLKKLGGWQRFAVYGVSGAAAMGLLRMILGSPLYPILNIPVGVMSLMGAGAGSILFVADRWDMITKPGLQYFSTTILGIVVSATSYGMMCLFSSWSRQPIPSPGQGTLIPLFFVLMGFLIVFGYSFPERWFKHRQAQAAATDKQQHSRFS